MTKNKKIMLTLLLAIILCGATAFFVYEAFSFQKVSIYVFNGNYEAGTVLTTDMFSTIEVDKKITNNGVKTNINDVFITDPGVISKLKGDTLRESVYEGMPVTRGMFATSGGSSIEQQLSAGKTAITIGINNITGVTNDLRNNSYVEVMIIGKSGIEQVLSNVRIIDVYKSDGQNVSAVTFECSGDELIAIADAATNKTIRLGLDKNKGEGAIIDSKNNSNAEVTEADKAITDNNISPEETVAISN